MKSVCISKRVFSRNTHFEILDLHACRLKVDGFISSYHYEYLISRAEIMAEIFPV